MSAYTVAGMLADLLLSQPTPAKTANPAKPRTSIDSAADNGTCEGLRKVANLPTHAAAPEPDSQKFAALRNPPCTPQSEHSCGSSQLSQLSQGLPWTNASARPYRLAQADADAAHAEPWGDAACGRFVARVSLFLRRGINATDADDLAERLHLRDVQGDDRRLCLECAHLAGAVSSGWRCGNAVVAGVGRELPGELVTMAQRCPAFRGAGAG